MLIKRKPGSKNFNPFCCYVSFAMLVIVAMFAYHVWNKLRVADLSRQLASAIHHVRLHQATNLLQQGAEGSQPPTHFGSEDILKIGRSLITTGHMPLETVIGEPPLNHLISWEDPNNETRHWKRTLYSLHDYRQLISALLMHGADANASTQHGWTALMWAAVEGNDDLIRLLLAKGARISLADQGDMDALDYAMVARNRESVTMLLNSGADVNRTDKNRRTRLMCTYDPVIITSFLDHGIAINATDETHSTALMTLVDNRASEEDIRILLRYGANVKMKNDEGNTALSIARKNGYTELIRLLTASSVPKER